MRWAATRACGRTRNLGDVASCRQSAWGGRTKGGVVGAVSAVSAVGIGDGGDGGDDWSVHKLLLLSRTASPC